ncbi:AFG1/ZapE family ATPase, partial [Acinetobacter baumannii]|uniref:AFG1/ZapE family ATPase n=1 Tax=Acinetobacter baumannii TaxID=470 RepID=UPI00114755E5
TDSVILSDLFHKVFGRGVTLSATSSSARDGLYKYGIHRVRTSPAVEEVKRDCVVLHVDAGVEYRLRVLKQAQLFKSPFGNEAQSWLSER